MRRLTARSAVVSVLLSSWAFTLFMRGQSSGGPVTVFTATAENVSGAGDAIRIEILRWSTDSERDQLLAAWSMKTPAGEGRGARSGGGRAGAASAGRGAAQGRGGRGAAQAEANGDEDLTDPFGTFRGGRATAGRGGANENQTASQRTPESTLAGALKQAATVGYLWSPEVAGYALRYAGKFAAADGSERIVLITDRRLGATTNEWMPSGSAAPSTYDFSVVELRLSAKGEGEGKVSVTGKVGVDNTIQMLTLDGYTALPIVLRNVKRSKS